MSSKPMPWRRRQVPIYLFIVPIVVFTSVGLIMLNIRSIDSSVELSITNDTLQQIPEVEEISVNKTINEPEEVAQFGKKCATVEEMGGIFSRGYVEQSLRVRRIIHKHFALNGAARVRELPPDQFCKHGFVIGKASEAGFGNEMYKILTAAGLSMILNRSLIIGQTRHIGINILSVITSPIPTLPLP